MAENRQRFAELLTLAVKTINLRTGRTLAAIQDELGYALHRSGSEYIQYLRKGHIPAELTDIATLARLLAEEGGFPDMVAYQSFLRAAGHPQVSDLPATFPAATAVRAALSANGLHPATPNGTIPPITPEAPDRSTPQKQVAAMLARLEAATYHQLVAAEEQLQALTKLVMPDTKHRIVALTGIGGIGKTSLADALLRRLVDQGIWPGIAWVTARQVSFNAGGAVKPQRQSALTTDELLQQLHSQLISATTPAPPAVVLLPHLAQHLCTQPHLIVIDNLEDVDDLATLLPTIRTLSNPSKFLLTTRKGLFAESDIAHQPVRELTSADAIRLVRQEAQMRNLCHVMAATDAELLPIYTTVGGNPLALRLVVGHLHTFALADVLADMQAKRGTKINNLYQHIYRKAWERLDEGERQALLAMLLVPESGAPLAYLEQVNAALATDELRNALNHLVTISLVDRRGALNEACYTIHNLTRTFLHEVIEW